MGPLVAIDTSIFIYHLEQNPQFAAAAGRILLSIEKGVLQGCFSVLGMLEILAGPKRLGRADIAAQYKYLIATFPNLTIHGVGEAVVDHSSDLIATYGLRAPDAIHLATAIAAGAKQFITNDRQLLRVREIEVRLLN